MEREISGQKGCCFLREPDRYFDFVAIMISAMSIIIGITFSSLLCGCLYGEFAELGTGCVYVWKWLYIGSDFYTDIYCCIFSEFFPHRIHQAIRPRLHFHL